MLTVGDKFPEFKLRANVGLEDGKQFADVTNPEGKWLVFYAYPKDFTFICPTEIVEFDKKSRDFADRDAVVCSFLPRDGSFHLYGPVQDKWDDGTTGNLGHRRDRAPGPTAVGRGMKNASCAALHSP